MSVDTYGDIYADTYGAGTGMPAIAVGGFHCAEFCLAHGCSLTA